MKINEVIQQVDLSKRAIKFYEEQHLLKVARDENGYRNYTEENIVILKKISVFRKLGIPIHDIKRLLISQDYTVLEEIVKKKELELERGSLEIEALKKYLNTNDIVPLYENIHYETIAQAIQDAIPGFYGYYFLHHFLPYLQTTIQSSEQQEAYYRIVNYWDTVDIKLPFVMRISGWIMYKMMPKQSIDDMIKKMEAQKSLYMNSSSEEYDKLKQQTLSGVKLKNNILYKYSIAGSTQRRFMRELQDKGYNDIFIPSMKILSPEYKDYHDALSSLNERICKDLGLYYDHNYNLILKK